MSNIVLKQLTKIFGEEVAVDQVDLQINEGEFLVLVGPSGCGKSTTLRMIAGLESPTSGEIWLGPENITNLPPRERFIGMVFQSYALYPHMTVAENMSFGLRLAGVDRMEILEKVDEVAAILGLTEHLRKKPSQLSGGQRQRVALGRAIIRNPNAFLFDEPLSNLDAKLRVQMRAEIQRLQRRTGITSIYVTHDQVEAMSMADRIAIMKKGIIQQVGAPTEVYLNPNNLFVATFIGSPEMNILQGSVTLSDGSYQIKTEIGTISVSKDSYDLEGKTGSSVYVGIRPEHLEIVTNGEAEFLVTPDVIEPLGSDTFLYTSLSGKQFAIRHQGLLKEDFLEKQGEVGLNTLVGHVHLFDMDNEQSLKIQ